ncbi:hypothetical protein ABIB86_000430 [Bradyrhizobium sp. JR1.7]|uniref:hypothetical protein n=1 Tax=unclassified Bradyrhizobium TaxID=2631580 RepID=UPI00339AC403
MSELQELQIAPPPGVVKTDSNRVIEGRWSDTINMRFVKQRPQKIGGWVKGFVTPTDGTPRTLHAWRDNSFNAYMAVGTYKKLYAYDPNLAQNDITPYRSTGTLGNNPFTTTNGSASITVAHTAHGLGVGDLIYLSGSTAVGGITPNVSSVPVITVVDSDHYTFTFSSPATSGATGGGAAVAFKYEVPVGVELGTYGLGWGVGPWGLGTWGTARASSTIAIEPRVWSLDHFGKLLLAAYNGGSIYQFDPTVIQPWGRATILDASAPTNVRAMFVTPERFVMALLDGMQVAWASQGTLAVWTPATGNTANVRTLTEGTKLVAGRVLADFVSLIWTDAALYRFQYNGSAYIYGSSMVAKDCGLISPNGCLTVGGIGYWMGQNNFWNYNGTVQPMPNVEDIRKYVFDNLKTDYGYQCNAVYNPTFNEVWFFYTINGQVNPTLGVVYSISEQCWAPLYWGRSGGTHFTQGDTRPYMGDPSTFLIYQHENGLDADGSILPLSMTLAPYGMTKGGKYNMMVEYLVPDFFQQTGDLTVTMTAWDRVNDTAPLETETETVVATDNGTVDARISGRYIGLTVSASSLGSYVRLGMPVAFIKTAGDRS